MGLPAATLAALLLIVNYSCSGFVCWDSNDNDCNTVVVVRGKVTSAQLASVVVDGSLTEVTTVTLLSHGAAQSLNFCGNSVHRFPMNQWVQVELDPGAGCNSIVAVAAS